MITLERKLRRLVAVDNEIYVLELSAGGLLLRRPRHRFPVAVLSYGQALLVGADNVRRQLMKRRHKPRSRKTAPRRSSRRRR